MADYKVINKELVEQVIMLRETVANIQKEHIYLQGKLMEEREQRIKEKQFFIKQIKRNFFLTLKNIDPDISLSNLYTNSLEASVTDKSLNDVSRRRTRNSLLEYRRSVSLRRSSVVNVSPVRRASRSSGECVEVAVSSPEVTESVPTREEGLGILHECEENSNQSETLFQSDHANTIMNLSTDSIQGEELSIENQRASKTSDEEDCRMSLYLNESNEEDSDEQTNLAEQMTRLDLEVTSSRGYVTQKRGLYKRADKTNEESCITEDNNHNFLYSDSVYSSIPAYSDFEISQDNKCSTPKMNASSATFNEISSNSTYNKPRRQCAPKTLKEPSLKRKMRNDQSKSK